jgi:hypothetical protein
MGQNVAEMVYQSAPIPLLGKFLKDWRAKFEQR